jgi:HNH endonuclease
MPFVTDSLKYLNKGRVMVDPASIHTKINKRLMKLLKYKSPTERLPEVDHIVPVYRGGQSIGFENHQAICYTCHKTKTKVDNAGPKKCPTCKGPLEWNEVAVWCKNNSHTCYGLLSG